MSLAVIIVNYRTADLTLAAVDSAMRSIRQSDRVYVVEGGSGDDSAERLSVALASHPQVEFLRLPENRGFAAGNNVAIRLALASADPPEYILLLNPDTLLRDGAIEALRQFMDGHPEVGLAGSRLEHPDGSSQLAARRFHNILNEFDSGLQLGPISWLLRWCAITQPEQASPHITDWVPGASLIIRRDVFDVIGVLDEGYFLYFEETDFCLRAKRSGFPCWYVPQSRVIHFIGQSSGIERGMQSRCPTYWFESRARYWLKNHGLPRKLASDIAWTFGRALFHVRAFIQRKPNPFPPNMWWDFVKFNFCSVDAWKLKH